MKKFLVSLLLIVLALFVLVSCGGNKETPTGDTNGTTQNSTENKDPAKDSPFKIPETPMRDWVVDYMYKMAKIKWTPSQTMDLTKDSKGGLVGSTLLFEKGQVYEGLPYINLTTDTDYEDFEAALKWNEGKQLYLYECPADRSEDMALGNDCSSAILLAWKRFDPNIAAYDTGSCFPLGEKTGIYPIGDIVVNGTEKVTEDIVKNTPEDVHYAALAQLQKGDMVIWRLKSATGDSVAGHTRMVIKVEVSKTGAGKINPHKSKVLTIEQTNTMDKQAKAKGINTNWYVEHEYTFKELRDKNLIPVTCKALSEERVEPKITVTGANTKKTITTVKDKLMGSIESNYTILKVTVNIKKADDTVIHSQSIKVHNMKMGTTFSLKEFDFGFDVSSLEAGDYKYTIDVMTVCGEGEVHCVEFSKK